MTHLFLGLVAFLGLVVQGTFFAGPISHYVRPDCVLVVSVYCGFHMTRLSGLVLVYLVGFIADSLSGMPEGWNVFFAVMAYGVTQWLRSQLLASGVVTQLTTTFFFTAVRDPLFLVLMRIIGYPMDDARISLLCLVGETSATVLATLLLIKTMRWIQWKEVRFPFGKKRPLVA